MELIRDRQPRRATGLTVGGKYEGRMVTANGENTENMDNASHFYCVNDKNSNQRYSIRLFIEPAEPEPVVIPDMTYDDVVAKLVYQIRMTGDKDDHDDANDILLGVSFNGMPIIDVYLEQWHQNDLSCGIIAIVNVGYLALLINNLEIDKFETDDSNLNLSDQDLADLKQLIFKETMTRLLVNNQLNLSYKFAMISDNDNNSEIHWDTLDEMSITDTEKNQGANPNGGNQIKFWVIPLTFIEHEDEDDYEDEDDEYWHH